MANLSILNGNNNSFYVMNGETRVATIYFDRKAFIINHSFSALGIKNLDTLGEYESTEACLPMVQKILDIVIKKLS